MRRASQPWRTVGQVRLAGNDGGIGVGPAKTALPHNLGVDGDAEATAAQPWEPRVILDAGMTELMRPALYGSLHRVHALRLGGTLEECERPALPAGGWELGERHRSAETSLV